MFTQGADDIEEFTQETWILIDTGSTFNSLFNADLLHDVVPCAPMQSLSNYGSLYRTAWLKDTTAIPPTKRLITP